MTNYVSQIERYIAFTVIFFLHPLYMIAQCAGTDGTVTICNKETDVSLQTFDLFSVINNATVGGRWIVENNTDSIALDEVTGVVNLWQVNRSGIIEFRYTHDTCDNSSSTASISLGGYPGESSQVFGDNNACQNDSRVNLFSFLTIPNGIIGPDINGVWTSNDPALEIRLTNEFFNFVDLPTGTYTFTYTTPEVDTCPSRTAIIDVELRKAPNSGKANNLSICETQDMSALTALDLFSRLDNSQDNNGTWTDVSDIPTGEITSGTDSEINVQSIYNNFGPGTYTFNYTVDPDHPICEKTTTAFVLCIEKQLKLEGTIDISCKGDATLNYDSSLLTNGMYNLNFTIKGANLGEINTTSSNINFENGIAEFNMLNRINVSKSDNLTIEITDITGGVICEGTRRCTPTIAVPENSFDYYINPDIAISSTTGCTKDDVLISYTNVIDSSFQPLEGEIELSYNINDVPFTDLLNFENGNAISILPASRFEIGNNTVFYPSDDTVLHCDNLLVTTNLILIPKPENPVFGITADNRCNASDLEFSFNAPENEFINYSSVTFDIYNLGTEPAQFAPRNPSTTLSNNTNGRGIDISITDRNDVSNLPTGDYVFVIRSVQNDNALCRGLSEEEMESYKAQDINIGVDLVNGVHIFDARLSFSVGQKEPATLLQNNIPICLDNNEVTLADIPLFAGNDVTITILNEIGEEVAPEFNITKDETFTAEFTSTSTGCELGSETLTINITQETLKPTLAPYLFCNLNTNLVKDLSLPNQEITWYNQELGGVAYTAEEELSPNNEYWGELTVVGGCISTERTLAAINFIDPPAAPEVQTNVFCNSTTPTINDLVIENSENAILTWYASETGPAYTDLSLALSANSQYWVTKTLIAGCESDRAQVTFEIQENASEPIPLANNFCVTTGSLLTLENLEYAETSLNLGGELSYFTDNEGNFAISNSTNLNDLQSPIYVQQNVGSNCISDIVAVNFSITSLPNAPTLQAVELCTQDNPTVQNLLELLEQQTANILALYETESADTTLDPTTLLANLSSTPFASQTVENSCESTARTMADYTLVEPNFPMEDFDLILCSVTQPILSDIYLGTNNITWFNENNETLPSSEVVKENTIYQAQIEINGCLTPKEQIIVQLIEVETPQPINTEANLCGLEENTLADLLNTENNPRFSIPENHNLVWYDSNNANDRTRLEDSDIIDESGSYFAIFEKEEQGFICESDAVEIIVNLTNCDENQLIIPDAFSPNGDTVNDFFELLNIEFIFPDYEIDIYNRYGRLVFQGNLEIGFWDGKSNQSGVISNNEVLPTGIYFYVIHYNKSEKAPLQGQVYLKR